MSDMQEQMQTKIAYLESAAVELSDVVYRQQREIEGLKQKLQLLIERLGATSAEEPARTPEQERPPHY
jgi:SlyX protein